MAVYAQRMRYFAVALLALGGSCLLPELGFAERITLEIETPEAGAERVANGTLVFVAGTALAHDGKIPALDIVFVIDVSGSTGEASGADVDRDGSTGRTLGIPGMPPIFSSRGDSILAAEVAAVENVITRLSPRTTRVGIVTFSHRSWVDAPLTHDYEEVRLALGDILYRGPEGGTNMKSGLLRGSIELIGTKSAASTRRKGAERVLVFVTDGRPTLPYAAGPFSSDGRNVREAVRSAEKAAKRGVRMHSFAVGKEAMDSTAPRAIARATGGIYTPVRNPYELPQIFDTFSFAEIETLTVRNLTMEADAVQLEHRPDGSFAALVPAGAGRHTLEVYARSRKGTEARRTIVVGAGPQSLDPAQRTTRARLLELHMQAEAGRARSRDVEIETER